MSRPLPRCIGVIHLPPLPGSPGAHDLHPARALQVAGLRAVKEAGILAKAGFDGIILENFGDAPFYGAEVPPETIASLSVIAAAVRESCRLPLGINVLRNDAHSALAIAAVTGADFIRVNVLSGVAATDQGMIEGVAARLIRERNRLGADSVAILADIQVKHARTLSTRSIALSIEEATGRGGADGVIVTGSTTGRSPEKTDLEDAISGASHSRVPLFIGSGLDADGVKGLPFDSDIRLIVGSSIRKGGHAGAPLDPKRIAGFMKAVKARTRRKNAKTRRLSS